MTNTETKKIAYSIKEAVEVLPICKMTLYRGVKDGSIPSRRVGNKILISANWIENFGKISEV